MEATAIAPSNIALVKYWGKRNLENNLPAVGSVSMTLSTFHTTTTVRFDENLSGDQISLDKTTPSVAVAERTSAFLDRIRKRAQISTPAFVESVNNFPTASGLASSASGFAALTLAAFKAAGIDADLPELAAFARMGSGSAPRSLLGGFVDLEPGAYDDGSDFSISQVADETYWNLALVVAVNREKEKKIGSTEGMERTRKTSPYYAPWIETNRKDRKAAIDALNSKDFHMLGQITERSCMAMHAVALSSWPPVLYWNDATVNAINKVWALREQGLNAYITIDAGPHVKVLCNRQDCPILQRELESIEGIVDTIVEGPGKGAYLL